MSDNSVYVQRSPFFKRGKTDYAFKQSKVKGSSVIYVVSFSYAYWNTSERFITLVHTVRLPVNESLFEG